MKKLFLVFCINFCLLFSAAFTPVLAGNGHDPGYACIVTNTCPPYPTPTPTPPPPQQSEASGLSEAAPTEENPFLTLSDLIITLILNSY